jgi:hypothetical protein
LRTDVSGRQKNNGRGWKCANGKKTVKIVKEPHQIRLNGSNGILVFVIVVGCSGTINRREFQIQELLDTVIR